MPAEDLLACPSASALLAETGAHVLWPVHGRGCSVSATFTVVGSSSRWARRWWMMSAGASRLRRHSEEVVARRWSGR